MRESLFSASWYRVADLKPRLRTHAQIHRQRFRGQVWYVLQDHQTGRFHRLSPAANLIACLMDGRRTMAEIWQQVADRLGEDQPTQDETIQLLAQLYRADLLLGDSPPDMAELTHRGESGRVRQLLLRIRNPLAMRFPLLDPDRLLTLTLPMVRPLFTTVGFLLWLALVVAGGALAVLHWDQLTANVYDRVLTAENILILVLVYPFVKAIHELGHGYATKRWGGEVHEIGIMLLVLFPVPYVDASAASAFQSKRRRAIVGGIGIMVEMALAAAAMIVWVTVEPGLVRAIAFNVMLIGGVSTVLFNGNPLLRFDGYYVLTDLIEIPNLGSRANRYVIYLLQRYGFGMERAQSPVSARGERLWFVFYAVASFLYRVSIVITIALFVAGQMFFLGIALALWALASLFVLPLLKGLRFLATSPQMHRQRRRGFAVVGLAVALLASALLLMPLPYATVAEGVVWTPEHAIVRTAVSGFVDRVEPRKVDYVTAGDVLLRLNAPGLDAEIAGLSGHVEELQLRLAAVRVIDRVQADMLAERLRHAQADLANRHQDREALTLRAPHDGLLVMADAADLPGRYLHRGDQVAYVLPPAQPVVRVIVHQSDVDLVRNRSHRVTVHFAASDEWHRPAEILREQPAAVADLPSMALSTQGGGNVALNPEAGGKPRALESLFQFDIATLPSPSWQDKLDHHPSIGERAYVRFDHGTEPLGFRFARALRQLLLGQFNV